MNTASIAVLGNVSNQKRKTRFSKACRTQKPFTSALETWTTTSLTSYTPLHAVKANTRSNHSRIYGFSNTSQRVERFLDMAFHAPSHMLRIARAFPALLYPLVFRWNFNHSTRLSTFPQAERRTFRGLTGTFSGVSNTMTVMNSNNETHSRALE